MYHARFLSSRLLTLLAIVACSLTGCQTFRAHHSPPPVPEMPRELSKFRLPEYVIEPPDILLVDAVSLIPKPPYRVGPGDALVIRVPGAPELDPIDGLYPIEPEGTVTLGASYGSVEVAGLTVPEIRDKITKHLEKEIKNPRPFVALGQSRGMQMVRGQHLVTPDGYIRLGTYGQVPVAGLTVRQAKAAIEQHLSQTLQSPEVSVDVAAYNSKLIYVVFDGGGNGQQIVRLPVTGNDTVLDVLAQAGGITPISSEHRVWVARPAPANHDCDQILPVDWVGVTSAARTRTNYQLMAGDRVYVQAQPIIAFDNALSKLLAPFERMFGFALLGNGTVRALQAGQGGGGIGGGIGGF
jgi:polysaccharide export outer membrane protein